MEKERKITSKVSLVQPNKVTNARYDYTAIQENILTCMIESIQDHLTKEKPIRTDLFGHPIVTLDASDIAKGKNKYHVFQQLRDLRKKDIDFEYTDEQGQEVEVSTGLISSFKSIKESSLIDVEISVWAIPYLLYWGKGVGGTIFSKRLALTLKSIYSKRIYKLCKRWENRGGFAMDLEELKLMLGVENKYSTLTGFKTKVLNMAKKELDMHSDTTFEYTLSKVQSRSYNVITFKIFSNKAVKENENTSHWYKFVYFFVGRTFSLHQSDRAQEITDQISNNGDLRPAYEKFTRIDDDFTQGKKSYEDVVKLTKHILKEDFGINVKGK